MKQRLPRFLIILAALLTIRAANALDIYNDNGGMAIAYAVKFERASKPIRVFGNCASACTLALKYPSTCAGPRASFAFHAATHPRITRWMMGQYPKAIRAWIQRHGGLTGRMIVLRGREMEKIVGRCE